MCDKRHIISLVSEMLIRLDGFHLEENKSEALYLDDIVLRELSSSQQEELYLQQYLG